MTAFAYQRLEFDSELFKFPVASATLQTEQQLSQLRASMDADSPRLFYLFSPEPLAVDNIQQETGYEVSYHEEKVIFGLDLNDDVEVDQDIQFSQWQSEDIPRIYELGLASGKYSRFALDNKIDTAVFERLYNLWVENSLNKTMADDIVIFRKDAVLGLITVKYTDGLAKVGLVAVNEEARGMGIGKKLLTGLKHRALQLNNQQVLIPTQRVNETACRFYSNNGYNEVESSFIYHCWNPNG